MQEETPELDNKSLRELLPLFKIGRYVPYITADITLNVHLSFFHAEAKDEQGELLDQALDTCTVHLVLPTRKEEDETGAHFDLIDYEARAPRGIETREAPFDLEEVVKALHLDIDAPIWRLRYE